MIGREHEKKKLLERYERQKAEFVAVYGRRRVGKTFLIDETFEGKFTFKHAGLSPVEIQKKVLSQLSWIIFITRCCAME